MKRCLLCVIFLLLCLLLTAAGPAEKVMDNAGLFNEAQRSKLRERATALSERHGFDILILTEEKPGITNSEQHGDTFYDNNGYGFGEQGDGVLLFINMGEREVYFSAIGRCEPLYLGWIDPILDNVYGYLAGDDYYGAAEAFLGDVERVITEAGALPEPILANPLRPEVIGGCIAGGAGTALIVLIVLIVLHMRSLPKPPSYRTYLNGGAKLRHQADLFLTTHTTRTRIQQNNGGGGGGGGRSRSGGTRKF